MSWFREPANPPPLPSYLAPRQRRDWRPPARQSAAAVPQDACKRKRREPEPKTLEAIGRLRDQAAALPGHCGRCLARIEGSEDVVAVPYSLPELDPALDESAELVLVELQFLGQAGWLSDPGVKGVLHAGSVLPIEILRTLVKERMDVSQHPCKHLGRALYKVCKPFAGEDLLVTLVPHADVLEKLTPPAAAPLPEAGAAPPDSSRVSFPGRARQARHQRRES